MLECFSRGVIYLTHASMLEFKHAKKNITLQYFEIKVCLLTRTETYIKNRDGIIRVYTLL